MRRVDLVSAVPHSILERGRERGTKKQPPLPEGCDFETAGSRCLPFQPCSSAAFVSRDASGCSTNSATPGDGAI